MVRQENKISKDELFANAPVLQALAAMAAAQSERGYRVEERILPSKRILKKVPSFAAAFSSMRTPFHRIDAEL